MSINPTEYTDGLKLGLKPRWCRENTVKIRLALPQDVDLLAMLEKKHLNDELASANMGLQGQAFSHS